MDRFLVLMPLIGHAHWFATPENDWANLFHLHIPQWLAISDKRVLDGYYSGFASIYESRYLTAWLPAIFWWTLFIVAIHLVMLCLCLIFRKQWVESERLSYPIIQLPFEMTTRSRRFFRSPWMWLGLSIGVTIDIINGLNFLFPAVPSLGGKLYDLRRIFTERPWNGIGWSPIGVFPFGVGLSFFIPLDLSFSCWAFWLIWRAERLLGVIAGWRGLPRFPYEAEQSHGAYLGLCVVAIWMSRRYLKGIARQLVSPKTDEPISYRLIVIGLLGGAAFIVAFCLKMGMSFWIIIVYFTIWFAIAIAITRLRAELGSPVHDLHFIGPDEMLPRLLGIRRLGATNLTGFAYLYCLNRAHRSHAMPHQLEGFKLADGANIPIRRFASLMMLASLLGALGSFWAYLSMYYAEGGRARIRTRIFQPFRDMADLRRTTGRTSDRFCDIRIRVDTAPRRNADAVLVVELTPCRLCHLRQLGDQPDDRLHLCWMATKVDRPEIRRDPFASESRPVFPRHRARRIRDWRVLEPLSRRSRSTDVPFPFLIGFQQLAISKDASVIKYLFPC